MTDKLDACTCNDDDPFCQVHVSCEDRCGALESPYTLPEWVAAADHWRNHGSMSGCSHGC